MRGLARISDHRDRRSEAFRKSMKDLSQDTTESAMAEPPEANPKVVTLLLGRIEWRLGKVETVRHVVGRAVALVDRRDAEILFAEPDNADKGMQYL